MINHLSRYLRITKQKTGDLKPDDSFISFTPNDKPSSLVT